MHHRFDCARSFIVVLLCTVLALQFAHAQRIVDKNKGSHFLKRKGTMDGNLVGTIYYNYGGIADWLKDPSNSGVGPKGTNHTYLDGVAIIDHAEDQDQQGNIFDALETTYFANHSHYSMHML